MQPGLVSILIVNWNTHEAILRCLDALPASIDGELRYEVIVVDNGSVDGSAEALRERTDITLISNEATMLNGLMGRLLECGNLRLDKHCAVYSFDEIDATNSRAAAVLKFRRGANQKPCSGR